MDDLLKRRNSGLKAKRGEVRFVLLDALRGEPKYGYDVIKALEERSAGQYIPSPGAVYPTLQYLVDLGWVTATFENGRRNYRLSESGEAELIERAEDIEAFWNRFKVPVQTAASEAETGFVEEDLEHLGRTVWNGVRHFSDEGDMEGVRRIRAAIENCRNEIRRIITG